MNQLVHILNYKTRSFLRMRVDYRPEAIIKAVGSFVVYSGFAIGGFVFARFATSYLLNEAHIGLFLLHRFISMVLFVFFVTINLGNMIVSYATLYRSQEVNFLLTQPVSFQKIFVIKFLDNFFYSSSTLSLVGLSVLLGYGSNFEMNWFFYFFIVFFVLLPFMLLAACVAVIILMFLMKLASKVNFKRLIATLVIGYLATVYLYFKLTNPMKLVNEVMKYFPNVDQYFGQLDPKFAPYLPSHWVADTLYFLVTKNIPAAIPKFQILILSTVGIFILALLIAEKLYYPTWLTSLEWKSQKSLSRKNEILFFDFRKPSLFSPQVEALLKKDFWQFFREPSQWIHFTIILFLVFIFVFSVSSIDLKLANPFLQTVSYLVIFVFNGFLITSIALRFVYPMISLEGDSFWSIRSAPFPLSKLFWIKFSVAAIFLLILSELLAVVSNYSLRYYLPLAQIAVVSGFVIPVGLVGLNLGTGAYFADYREKNPIRIASSQGASLTFLVSLLYLTLLVAVLFYPVEKFFEHIFFGMGFSGTIVRTALEAVLLISLLGMGISVWVGLRSLKRDF